VQGCFGNFNTLYDYGDIVFTFNDQK